MDNNESTSSIFTREIIKEKTKSAKMRPKTHNIDLPKTSWSYFCYPTIFHTLINSTKGAAGRVLTLRGGFTKMANLK